MNPHDQLLGLKPEKEFFIGIDSDGCAFDTMEIKQKECFCPNFIKYFKMQPVSKYARETWEFVNLYSTTRGCNRFLAVNEDIEKMVFGITPFPFVKECLEKMIQRADAMVVSQTPYEALKREWEENK